MNMQTRKPILPQAILSTILSLIIFFSLKCFVISPVLGVDRLEYTLKWMIVIPTILLVLVFNVALRRTSPEEGTGKVSDKLRIHQSILQNTLEQSVIAFSTWILLSMYLPQHELNIVPALTMLFLLGRILFVAGYLITPVLRVFGFIMTILPNFVALIYLLYIIF